MPHERPSCTYTVGSRVKSNKRSLSTGEGDRGDETDELPAKRRKSAFDKHLWSTHKGDTEDEDRFDELKAQLSSRRPSKSEDRIQSDELPAQLSDTLV